MERKLGASSSCNNIMRDLTHQHTCICHCKFYTRENSEVMGCQLKRLSQTSFSFTSLYILLYSPNPLKKFSCPPSLWSLAWYTFIQLHHFRLHCNRISVFHKISGNLVLYPWYEPSLKTNCEMNWVGVRQS